MDIEKAVYLELDFQPNVELVTVVRRFVNEFYDRVLGDTDVAARIALATHELLENSVKYCSTGPTRIKIEIGPRAPSRLVRIQTSNQASAEHRAVLEAAFARMHACATPDQHYQLCIEEAARRSVGSGLGIARIQCEGEMTLTLRSEGDQVSIVAETHTPEEVSTWMQ